MIDLIKIDHISFEIKTAPPNLIYLSIRIKESAFKEITQLFFDKKLTPDLILSNDLKTRWHITNLTKEYNDQYNRYEYFIKLEGKQ